MKRITDIRKKVKVNSFLVSFYKNIQSISCSRNFILAVVSVLTFVKLNAQGGDNAAAAASVPITIPFSATGSTMNAVSDYNYPAGLSNFTTADGDWLYYFCANQTGLINITLQALTGTYNVGTTNEYVYGGSVSVWSGVPGAGGTLVASTYDALNSNAVYCFDLPPHEYALQFNAANSSCYYIMVDGYEALGFNYTINVQYVPISPLQPSCTNTGFEMGNYTGWTGTYGHSVVRGAPGDPTPKYIPANFGFNTTDFQVTSGAGTDPIAGFPIVCPGMGTNSLRLGDYNDVAPSYTRANNGGASIEQKFSVTASNAQFIYNYAVVIQDAGTDHANDEQPFFRIDAFDCDGNLLPCGQYLVTGGPGVPGFTLVPGTTSKYYKNWTPVLMDLSDYIGSCVSIRFTVADCSRGAHFAYAYIDATCGPLEITGPTNVCPNTPFSLVAPIGGATYEWTVVGNSTVIGTNQTLTTTQTAANVNYQCKITTVAGCVTILTFNAGLFPPVLASSTSTTICEGSTGTITASGNPLGGSYLWMPGNITNASMSSNPSSTTQYTCTYTDQNGCAANAIGTINVNPIPIAPVAPSVNYCLNDLASPLSATANANCSLNWYLTSTGGIASTVAPTPNTAMAGPVTYYVSQSSLQGCEGPRTPVVVTVNPLPVVSVNSPTICPSETAILTAAGALTYVWEGNALLTANPFNVTPGSTTSYAVVGTDAKGCSSTAIATVTVLNSLTVNVNSATICVGETISLVATGANTYDWNTAVSGSTLVVTPSMTTSYVVTGELNGCTGIATAVVTVNPLPPVPLIAPVTYCKDDDAVSLTAVASSGCVLNWYGTNATGGSSSVAAPIPSTSIVGDSYFYVSQTNINTGCESPRVMITVTVNPPPVAPIVSPIEYCQNEISGSLTAIVSVGCTLNWYPDMITTVSSSNGPIPNTSVVTTLTYYVSQSNTNTGCESPRVPLTVVINPLPPTPIVSDVTYCQNDVALPLSAILGDPSYILNWYVVPDGGSATTTAPIPSTISTGLTSYYVSQYNPITGCESPRAKLDVMVNTPVTPTFSAVNPICEGGLSPVLSNSSVDAPAIAGAWNSVVSTTVVGTTTYTFTPDIGQCAVPTTLDIEIVPMPTLQIINPLEVCEPATVDITNPAVTSGLSGNYTYWENAACTIPLVSPTNISVSGVFFILNSMQSCMAVSPVTVVVNPNPNAAFTANPTEISNLYPHSQMQNNSTGAISYFWDFYGNYTSTLVNPDHFFEETESGEYIITLIATNEYGCVDTAYGKVIVNEELLFYVPNTFTPDKDHYNEMFVPVFTSGFDPFGYTLFIFDRWGELIFESHDVNVGWQGTYGPDHIQCQDGTYTWKIIYKLKNNNSQKVVFGHVNLLK